MTSIILQVPATSNYKIAGVSRGKGQDLFLHSFYESLQIIQEKKLQVPSIHAVIVGSDMNAQTKFEKELRDFVIQKKLQNRVHFVNKTLTVVPYLAAIDVLVQNSQVSSNFSCYIWLYCSKLSDIANSLSYVFAESCFPDSCFICCQSPYLPCSHSVLVTAK